MLIETRSVGPLPSRLYRQSAAKQSGPLVLHLHGGSFVGGTVEMGQTVAGLLAEAGAVVASVGYPVDAPFPHALEAAFEALKALSKMRQKLTSSHALMVAGEEAGGNLAAALTLMARDQGGPVLAGQILIAPMLNPDLGTCSMRDANAGPVGCKWADGWQRYLGSASVACNPYAAPSNASRLTGLASALILTAEDDPMRDDSVTYAARLRQSGVPVSDKTLAAPTGWPCALGQTSPSPQVWTEILRDSFTTFFNTSINTIGEAQQAHPPAQSLSHNTTKENSHA